MAAKHPDCVGLSTPFYTSKIFQTPGFWQSKILNSLFWPSRVLNSGFWQSLTLTLSHNSSEITLLLVNLSSKRLVDLYLKPWSNRQVVASGSKLNLRRDLTNSQVSSQVHASRKKALSRQTYPVFHWLIIG